MKAHGLIVASAIVVGMPALAAGQGGVGRVSIQGALGTNANVGGDVQALSVGFWPGDRIGILVGAERIQLEHQAAGVFLFVPVRGGLAWRF